MADFPSRGVSLKAFDEQGLVRLRNEIARVWDAIGLLKEMQPAPAEVSTEPESDQGLAYYTEAPVVPPDPTDPVPDDDPGSKADPLSMSGFSVTVTPHTSGKFVTISWDLWPGVSNPKVAGYLLYWSTSSPCPITDANLQRTIHGNRTSIDIKAGKNTLETGVTYDFRVVAFSKDSKGKKIYGAPSD